MKSLSYILQNYKSNHGIVSSDFDRQFLQWLVGGMKQLRTNFKLLTTCVKDAEIPIINHIAQLPQDCVRPLRVGTCCNGVWLYFIQVEDLCVPTESCPCDSSQVNQQINCCVNQADGQQEWIYPTYGQPYSYSYQNGSYFIGPSHGRQVVYTYDEKTNTIIFDRCLNLQSFRLTYIGDFMTDMGNALVPERIADLQVLENFAEYQRKVYSPNPTIQKGSATAYQVFYQSVRDAFSDKSSIDYWTWLALIRDHTYLGVRA